MSEIEPGSEEWLRRVEEAIARLKPRDREIFISVRIDGLSYEEAAKLYRVTIDRVTRAMAKALRAIASVRRNEPPPPWWQFWRD